MFDSSRVKMILNTLLPCGSFQVPHLKIPETCPIKHNQQVRLYHLTWPEQKPEYTTLTTSPSVHHHVMKEKESTTLIKLLYYYFGVFLVVIIVKDHVHNPHWRISIVIINTFSSCSWRVHNTLPAHILNKTAFTVLTLASKFWRIIRFQKHPFAFCIP